VFFVSFVVKTSLSFCRFCVLANAFIRNALSKNQTDSATMFVSYGYARMVADWEFGVHGTGAGN